MLLDVCRAGLKAELGAFYPLLLLRPMEAERPELGQLHAALSALQDLSSQPQLLVRAPNQSLSLLLCTSSQGVRVPAMCCHLQAGRWTEAL